MKFDDLHKQLSGFDALYQDHLYEDLKNIYPSQNRIVFSDHYPKLVTMVGALLAAPVLFFLGQFELAVVFCAVAAVMFILIINSIFEKPDIVFDISEVNDVFLPELCQCFGLEYDASPEGASIYRFMMTNAMHGYEACSAKYGVRGTFGGLEIDVNYGKWERVLYSSGHEDEDLRYMDGLLIKTPFPKKISGYTYIFNNGPSATNFLSPASSSCRSVDLENREFRDTHHVYSTDQVAARYILTPTFMEKVMELEQIRAIGDYRILVCEAGIYIFLANFKGFFNGSCYELTSENFIKYYIHNITTIFRVIETLDLDVKTKI